MIRLFSSKLATTSALLISVLWGRDNPFFPAQIAIIHDFEIRHTTCTKAMHIQRFRAIEDFTSNRHLKMNISPTRSKHYLIILSGKLKKHSCVFDFVPLRYTQHILFILIFLYNILCIFCSNHLSPGSRNFVAPFSNPKLTVCLTKEFCLTFLLITQLWPRSFLH